MLGRITTIWHHVLTLMARGGVTLPVLPAIGCGIFADNIPEVPRLYARALLRLLVTESYGFQAVCLCLPGPAVNYDAFLAEFSTAGPVALRCSVTRPQFRRTDTSLF